MRGSTPRYAIILDVRCLVIGATGYVGARLVPRLLADGHVVRCLVRDEAKLARLDWARRVQACAGDAADRAATDRACAGIDTVFYLVHSMTGPDFAARDLRAAAVVATAARAAGVGRIVYLSGLQPAGDGCSEHLRSRRAVGEVLLAGGVPTVVLQAGIVLGSGSASFEMIRHLADGVLDGLPVLLMPDHAWHTVQPIGIDDVLHHLVGCAGLPPGVNRTFDVGGPEVLSYRELLAGYLREANGGRPVAVPVPLVAPGWAARAVEALTPVSRHLAGPLLASMAHDLVCRDREELVGLLGEPPGGATSYREAVRRALDGRGAAGLLPTDLPGSGPPEIVSEQVHDVDAPADLLWSVITGLGGDTGWYTVPGVWRLRGFVDGLLGGVGARRVRPAELVPGAALDWWRIEAVDDRLLRLRAETKLPGTARLELRAEPTGPVTSRYVQRVTFRPRGAAGRLYWYAQLPAHELVFAVMAQTLTGVAERRARAGR